MHRVQNFQMQILASRLNLAFVSESAKLFTQMLGSTAEDAESVRIAVAEAFDNICNWAYEHVRGTCTLRMGAVLPNTLRITISDKGKSIPNVEEASEPMWTEGDHTHSGMGISVMKANMDTFEIQSTILRGTTIIMTKVIK